MKKLISFLIFFSYTLLWAAPATFQDYLAIKLPVKKAYFLSTIGFDNKIDSKIKIGNLICEIDYEDSNDFVTEFSLECEKALPRTLFINEKTSWERLSSISKHSSAIRGDFVIGDPYRGHVFHLNGDGNIISFHSGKSWKPKKNLKKIEKILNDVLEEQSMIKKRVSQ